MGCVYGIKNTINEKWYIGQTVSDNPKKRINHHFGLRDTHAPLLYRAIKKYGVEVFEAVVIEDNIPDDQSLLDSREVFHIASYNSIAPNGCNIKEGGSNGRHSEESRRKMSKSHKDIQKGEDHPMFGKSHSAEAKEKIGRTNKGNKHFLGKKHSSESKLKIGKAHKGKKVTTETRRKMSKSHKGIQSGENHPMFGKPSSMRGKKHSVETKTKMSKKKKGKNTGIDNHFYGKKHSAETKEKMSKAHKGRSSPMEGRKHTPETRAKMSESQKKSHNERKVNV